VSTGESTQFIVSVQKKGASFLSWQRNVKEQEYKENYCSWSR